MTKAKLVCDKTGGQQPDVNKRDENIRDHQDLHDALCKAEFVFMVSKCEGCGSINPTLVKGIDLMKEMLVTRAMPRLCKILFVGSADPLVEELLDGWDNAESQLTAA
jgi:hypothetical protein